VRIPLHNLSKSQGSPVAIEVVKRGNIKEKGK
jgi:hypothetical protein